MVALTTWDPFSDLEETTNRLASAFGRGLMPKETDNRSYQGMWSPLVDITEDEKEYLIKAELPEIEKKDVKVTVENGILNLTGERRHEEETKEKKTHRIERFFGAFSRSFTLPEDADGTKVTAEFKNGLLLIRMPKNEMARPKQIEVKVS